MEGYKIYELNECITESGDMSPKCATYLTENKYRVNDNVSIRTHLYGYRWATLRFAREELKATFILGPENEFKYDKNNDYVYAEKYQIESVKFRNERFYDKYLNLLSSGDFSECSHHSIDFIHNEQYYDLSDPNKSFYRRARTHVSKPYSPNDVRII